MVRIGRIANSPLKAIPLSTTRPDPTEPPSSMSAFLFAVAAAAAMPGAERVFSVYDFGARGDGRHNEQQDTAHLA